MDLEKELNELKEKMTPKNAFKFITGTLISLGATAAIIAALRNPLAGARGLTKLLMKLGIFVLAMKAGDAAKDYFEKTLDDAEKDFVKASNDITKEIRMKGEIADASEKG